MQRISPGLTPLALLVVVGVAAPSAQAQAPAGQTAGAAYDTETGQALSAWDCNTGTVCFWTGFGGTGGRCTWEVADADWTSGAVECPSVTGAEVRSVYNRGTSSAEGVAFYGDTGFTNRIGCTRQGQKSDLAGIQVRSHQWTSSLCD